MEVFLIACVHVGDLGVVAKVKEIFGVDFVKLLKKPPVNDMDDPSWYRGCTF